MRKLDTLILKSFVGPFVLTTVVATFVLLLQYMMKYFDDFVGKDLGFEVFAELLFYFSLNMLQVALPLGVLVSSLMTFGNLGENFELTAIKSAGISLVRALRPIFFFVCLLTFLAFNFNNYVVPAANLKAYSLLYDIKHKKPALDLKEGVFYNGIPDYSIKVQQKLPDNKTLKNVLIYDHSDGPGNNRVIMADSSRMFMIYNDRYLKLELFDGNYYNEEPDSREPVDKFYRTNFKRMDMVFNLSSFDLKRTKEELFQNNRQMKNISELTKDMDSLDLSVVEARNNFYLNAKSFYSFHFDSIDVEVLGMDRLRAKEKSKEKKHLKIPQVQSKKEQSASMISFFTQQKTTGQADLEGKVNLIKPKIKSLKHRNDTIEQINKTLDDSLVGPVMMDELSVNKELGEFDDSLFILEDSLVNVKEEPVNAMDTLTMDYLNKKLESRMADIMQTAKNQAQNVKINLSSVSNRVNSLEKDYRKYTIEKWRKYSQAFACIVMFLIGAPLGSIIKKGGMGVPVIFSIVFFLIYYIINIISEKSANEGVMDPVISVWVADLALLPVGLFFLRQARIDAKLFDTDFYEVWMDKIKMRFRKR